MTTSRAPADTDRPVLRKLLWANPRLGLRANIRGQIDGKVPPGVDGTYQPSYDLWSVHVSKRFASLDIFLARADGTPVQGQFQVWLAPRTFQVGVRLDMDWAE